MQPPCRLPARCLEDGTGPRQAKTARRIGNFPGGNDTHAEWRVSALGNAGEADSDLVARPQQPGRLRAGAFAGGVWRAKAARRSTWIIQSLLSWMDRRRIFSCEFIIDWVNTRRGVRRSVGGNRGMACLPYGRGPGPVHGIRLPPSAAGIRRCGLAAVLATLLAGCAGSALLPSGAEDHGNPGLRLTAIELLNRQTPITEPTRRALEALSRGQFSSANQHFSLALGRDSRNAALHAMNALTYHLRVRQGERDLLELAETGYLVSLEQRRDFLPSALQLTRLYLENGRFEEAKRAAIYALDLEPDSDEALQLLAAAAYYDGDVELSLWAIEEARSLKPADRRLATMRPLIYGAAGLDDEARRALQDTAAAGLLDDRR